MPGKLVVRNKAQKILFEQELAGQISDGHWENLESPRDHWVPWCEAECVVGGEGEPLGPTFYAQKKNYYLDDPKLLDCVGDRMVEAVAAEIPGYTWADMKKDLRDLRKIFKGQAVPRTSDDLEREMEASAH